MSAETPAPLVVPSSPSGCAVPVTFRSGLGEYGLSVNSAEPPENLDALDVLCSDWRARLASRHRSRARGARSRGNASTAHWYKARAGTLEEPYAMRAARCETQWLGCAELGCSSCGLVRGVPMQCGLWRWCEGCAKRRRGGWYKRAVRGLGSSMRELRAAWNRGGRRAGLRPDVTMVTLTVRHSGSIETDRDRILSGWQTMRKWLHRRDGFAAPYVLAWELTPGTDGGGHVHAHVVAVWPWRELRELDAVWSRSTDGAGSTVDVRGVKRLRASKGRHVAPKAAASYAASYVGKGGLDPDCSLELRAEWLRIHAEGARAYTSSRGMMTVFPPESSPCCQAKEFMVCLHRGRRKLGDGGRARLGNPHARGDPGLAHARC